MAAGTKGKTVWIGFMDTVPVIGTVKEAVELVLALYEGNEAAMKEKEKAVEDFVEESLKKRVKPRDSEVEYFPPDGSGDGAAASSEFSGLKNVKEIRKEMIIEYMGKGSKKGAKGTPAEKEQKKRQRKIEEIKKDMLKKIRLISPGFKFSEELEEESKRSKRGEHVFNNNILEFHSKVLNDFIRETRIKERQGYDQEQMDELGRHTFKRHIAEEIQYNMVVQFADDEFYVNANAIIYGEYRKALSDALLDVLRNKLANTLKKSHKNRLNLVIDNMNNHEIYVDQLAKIKWIDNTKDRKKQFEKVKRKVGTMYRAHRSFAWCYEIVHKVNQWNS